MTAKDTKTAKEDSQQKKRERRPINGHRTILEVRGKEPGFHYAWIADDKVFAATEGGFEYVTHPVEVGHKRIDVSTMQGSKISRNLGGGLVGYLMRIPQEWYDEDMASEQERVNEQERARVKDSSSDGLTGTIRVKT
jgi:hypothetical protein